MKKQLSQDSPTMSKHTNTLPTKKSNGAGKKMSPKRKKSKPNNKMMITSSLSFQKDSNLEAAEKNGSKEPEPKVKMVAVIYCVCVCVCVCACISPC